MTDVLQKQKKKRGRKPKGGKIINKELTLVSDTDYKPSIILHLKCSSESINNDFETITSGYDGNSMEKIEPSNLYDINFTNLKDMNKLIFNAEQLSSTNEKHDYHHENDNDTCGHHKQLIHNLSIEDYKKIIYSINNKFHTNKDGVKSDCFWCNCSFETPSIHIPKNHINDKYNVYGFFCSVECASGFLFNESINMSDKFERYTMLNVIYADIIGNNYITPAPSPYYLLSRFCGSMTIDEYRNLYTTNYNVACIKTPNSLNIEFPELHLQMNDNSSVHNYDAATGGGFKIQKASSKTKKSIDNYFNL